MLYGPPYLDTGPHGALPLKKVWLRHWRPLPLMFGIIHWLFAFSRFLFLRVRVWFELSSEHMRSFYSPALGLLEKHSESADLRQALHAAVCSSLNEEPFKVIQDWGFLPNHPQNWITCSFWNSRHYPEIFSKINLELFELSCQDSFRIFQNSFRITPKIQSLVVFGIPNNSWKFQENPSITFWIILPGFLPDFSGFLVDQPPPPIQSLVASGIPDIPWKFQQDPSITFWVILAGFFPDSEFSGVPSGSPPKFNPL